VSSLASDLFSNTLTAYNTARRWFYWGVLLLFLIQILFIGPYHKLSATQKETVLEIAKHEERQAALEQLQSRFEEYREAVSSARRVLVLEPTKELVARFDRLNKIVLDLREMGPDEAAGHRGTFAVGGMPADFQPGSSADVAQRPSFSTAAQSRGGLSQAQAVTQSHPIMAQHEPESYWWDGYQPMAAETRRQVAVSQTQRDLLDVLEDFIETHLVSPLYEQLEQQWQDRLLPAIQNASKGVEEALQIEPWSVGIGEQLDAISSDLAKSLTVMQAMQVKPPTDRFWWSNQDQKAPQLEAGSQGLNTSEKLIEKQLAGASSMEAEVDRMITDAKAMYEASAEERAELEKLFKEMQKDLSSAATPLPSLALDLDRAAPWFPLWLGLALAALTISPALQLRKLAQLLPALSSQDDHKAARLWLLTEVGDPAQRILAVTALKAFVFAIWVAFFAAGASDGEEVRLYGGLLLLHVLGVVLVFVAAVIEANSRLGARRLALATVRTD
jgi:hypothetical protein